MADKNLAQVVAERDEARAEVERLRDDSSELARHWFKESDLRADDALARVKALADSLSDPHAEVDSDFSDDPIGCIVDELREIVALAEPTPAAAPHAEAGADVPFIEANVLREFADHDLHGLMPYSEIGNRWYHAGLDAAQSEAREWAEQRSPSLVADPSEEQA